jgi:DNA modification methylase
MGVGEVTKVYVLPGDCLALMRQLPDGFVDSVVTDPPYGLSFRGKEWDRGVPGAPFWAEALRVAKPGTHLVAFGGTRTFHRLTCAIEDAGWEIRDCLSWLYGSGFPKSHNGPWGGTALKPAWEPAILARAPLIGTVEANHAAHGTGGINVDGCRIASPGETTRRPLGSASMWGTDAGERWGGSDAGRWPANVCLDEDAAAALDAQTGITRSGTDRGQRAKGGIWSASTGAPCSPQYGDSGGASRFFYCAKASKSERGPTNTHPTVKPLALMRWVVRMVTPPGGIVLDPFAGSGTTGLAARAEGFRSVLMEQDPGHVQIIHDRIAQGRAV